MTPIVSCGQRLPCWLSSLDRTQEFRAFLDMLFRPHHDARLNFAKSAYQRCRTNMTNVQGSDKAWVVFEYLVKDSEAPVSNAQCRHRWMIKWQPPLEQMLRLWILLCRQSCLPPAVPAFSKANANLSIVVSQKGASGLRAARKFGFRHNVSFGQYDFVNGAAPNIVIASRHDAHFDYVSSALEHGRNVLLKSLCASRQESWTLQKQYQQLQTSHPGRCARSHGGLQQALCTSCQEGGLWTKFGRQKHCYDD